MLLSFYKSGANFEHWRKKKLSVDIIVILQGLYSRMEASGDDKTEFRTEVRYNNCLQLMVTKLYNYTGLPLSFESPVALIFTPLENLLLFGWILAKTVKFTHNIEGPSNILSCRRLYWLEFLLTGLLFTQT